LVVKRNSRRSSPAASAICRGREGEKREMRRGKERKGGEKKETEISQRKGGREAGRKRGAKEGEKRERERATSALGCPLLAGTPSRVAARAPALPSLSQSWCGK
jgi:hypothetical protein